MSAEPEALRAYADLCGEDNWQEIGGPATDELLDAAEELAEESESLTVRQAVSLIAGTAKQRLDGGLNR